MRDLMMLSVLLLGACEHPEATPLVDQTEEGGSLPAVDVEALTSWYMLEDAAVANYGRAVDELPEPFAAFAATFLLHHAIHRDELATRLGAMGAELPPPAEPGPLPPFDDPRTVVGFVLGTELQLVAAEMGLAAQMVDPEHRRWAANAMGGEMTHTLAVMAVLGDGQVPLVPYAELLWKPPAE